MYLQLGKLLSTNLFQLVDRISFENAELELRKVTDGQTKICEKLHTKKTKSKAIIDINKSSSIYQIINLWTNKGLNFAITPRKVPMEEIIRQVESAIRTLSIEDAEEVRHVTCQLLRKSKVPARNISRTEYQTKETQPSY